MAVQAIRKTPCQWLIGEDISCPDGKSFKTRIRVVVYLYELGKSFKKQKAQQLLRCWALYIHTLYIERKRTITGGQPAPKGNSIE